MRNKSASIVLLLLSTLLFSCSTLLPDKYVTDVSQGQCLPAFPDKDCWYGGDGAYSIKLDDRRTLWLFGDTFVSCEERKKDRVGMDVILGTTLGVSVCDSGGKFDIHYYLKNKSGKFISSFGEGEWLWPQDPFLVNNVLYIPLIAVAPTDKEGEVFNFKITGHRFARIKDFSAEDPRDWKVDYIDLKNVISPDIAAFAATSVVDDHYVYFFPFYVHLEKDPKVFGNILARIPADKIDHPSGTVEYLDNDGTWEKDLDPGKIKVVLDAGVSELSVRYHSEDKKWIAVYLTTQNKGNKLLYREADRLEGPWGAPKVLESEIPEVDPGSGRYDKNNFCYAGKEHQEFSRDRKLVVTYVCNSLEDLKSRTSFIRRNLFLYRPVVLEKDYR